MAIPLITRVEDLPEALASSITRGERAAMACALPPFAVTPFYASLVGPSLDDPLRKQCISDPRERLVSPGESPDPLGAHRHQKTPRLVHQYPSRVLLLSTGHCAGYCRHCFRRDWELFSGGWIGEAELEEACGYISSHPEVDEVLVSGGDPLTAGDAALENLLSRLRAVKNDLVIRLGTRVPVTWPYRLDGEFPALLARYRPLRLIVHVNHPRELPEPVRAALARVIDRGIPVHSQTVLLKGVNDSEQTLAELFRALEVLGVNPYYLFQGDLARGTGHLRTDLRDSLSLHAALSSRLSPLALPPLAVDLPGGRGKLVLPPGLKPQRVLVDSPTGPWPAYLLHSASGEPCHYPCALDRSSGAD